MLKATVCYYPQSRFSFGHIGVKITFPEGDNSERPDVKNLIKYVENTLDDGSYADFREEKNKKEARINYRPILYKKNERLFIYGNKDGLWQETAVDDENELRMFNDLCVTNRHRHEIELNPTSPVFKIVSKAHTQFKRTEYFFDFGGGYDFEDNMQKRGEPICIELPENERSWIDFFTMVNALEDCYYFVPGEHASGYNELKNNCAHATLQVLYMAGYMDKKPAYPYALTPLSAAKKICKIANNARALSRIKLAESLSVASRNDPEHIKALIQASLLRIRDGLNFGSSYNSKSLTRDQKILSEIRYDGSSDSIDRLLHASEKVRSETAEELEQCLSILSPGVLLKATIARLNTAADGLDQRNFSLDAKASRQLAKDLMEQTKSFEKKEISHNIFAQKCSALLDAAKPTLEKHRDYNRMFKNIALAIAGLIALYLIAICINKAVNGHFLFFDETKLSRIAKTIKKEVDQYSILKLANS